MNPDQEEEIEAIKSIYLDDFSQEIDSYVIKISPDVKLYITLNEDYPTNSPPTYQLLAPSISKQTKEIIAQGFDDIYINNLGQPLLFQWIERLKEILDENEAQGEDKETEAEVEVIEDKLEHLNVKSNYDFFHGPLIQDRKSTFQGHVCSITSEDDVRKALNSLLENRKIAQATHNITAYRIEKDNNIVQDWDDDGETHAGGRLLHLLQILSVRNVFVVVTRWYGGIHLGPDRFRHINNAARQVLEAAGIIKK